MPLDPTVKLAFLGLFAVLVVSAVSRGSIADGIPGRFDFYVLALSWSPTYCLIDDNADPQQCRGEPRGFVVHGLWPQYEKGYPEYCHNSGSRWVSDAIVASMFEIMPDGGLVGGQWRKHGVCSGLNQADYFDLVRKAYRKVRIPEAYSSPTRNQTSAPDSVETAFIDSNPGLKSSGIAVTCSQNSLLEVRICLTKVLDFRDCREVDRNSCRSSRIDIPASN